MNDDMWIKDNTRLTDIVDSEFKMVVHWEKDVFKDLLNLAQSYFNSAHAICFNIVSDSSRNNVKFDMWFLPTIFLFRHSIELLMKAGIALAIQNKRILQDIFSENKHNLSKLFITLEESSKSTYLTTTEKEWLKRYLDDIEFIDCNSDVFRYPHSKEFLNQYGNKFINVAKVSNRLMYCYSLIHKMILNQNFINSDLSSEEASLFVFTNHGIGHCHLWDSEYGDGFHKQIVGYSQAADYLYELYDDTKNIKLIFPLVFLYRNAIELALKRILLIQTEYVNENYKFKAKRNSHLIIKDLWKHIKPILIYYGGINNYDLFQLEIAEQYLRDINKIDKNGDTFRYPFTYSIEYKLQDIEIDVSNFHTYLKSIFVFLDSCDSMLNDIKDFESEMRSYYNDY